MSNIAPLISYSMQMLTKQPRIRPNDTYSYFNGVVWRRFQNYDIYDRSIEAFDKELTKRYQKIGRFLVKMQKKWDFEEHYYELENYKLAKKKLESSATSAHVWAIRYIMGFDFTP